MSETKNESCIKIHENHDVRIETCEKDITKLGISLRSDMKNLWTKLDKYVYVIVGTGVFQATVIIVAIYLKG